MKQLVVFFGAIGDTILIAPAIKKLAEKGDVFVVGYKERIALLEKVGWVKKTYSPDDVDFASFFTSPSEQLRNFLMEFDIAYFFMRDGDIFVKAARNMGVQNVYAFAGTPPDDWKRHASDYYLHCFGLPSYKDFILPIKTEWKHREIIIHPGSGSPKKNMSTEFFIELTNKLLESNLPVRWCLGPAEENISVPQTVPTLPQMELVKLAEFLAGASVYIGNDSGISHLAGAIGIKTVVLFHSTNPEIWKPLGPHVYPFTSKTVSTEKIYEIICKIRDL